MPPNDIQSKVDALLTERRTQAVVAREAFIVEAIPPQPGVAQVAPVTRSAPRFSFFDPAQLRRAIELAARLMEIADTTGGDAGLRAAISDADALKTSEDLELVKIDVYPRTRYTTSTYSDALNG